MYLGLDLTTNSFTVEGIARGVPLDKLYEFYTDYSPEDVEIMKKHGMQMALERVAKREGNHVVVDTTAKMMGMTKNMRYDIMLHPDEHSYVMTIDIKGVVRSQREYRFEGVPGGTKITISDEYQLTSLLSKMLNGLGMLKKRMVSDTTRTMNAFIAEAEERSGSTTRVSVKFADGLGKELRYGNATWFSDAKAEDRRQGRVTRGAAALRGHVWIRI